MSGGAFNPAVGFGATLGEAIFANGSWSNLWLYIVGPLAGHRRRNQGWAIRETGCRAALSALGALSESLSSIVWRSSGVLAATDKPTQRYPNAHKSPGPMMSTILEPTLFSFESVVNRRHVRIRARAKYSASYVLAQPRRSAISHASSISPLGRRGLTRARLNRSSAMVASSFEITLRHRSSCSTDDASDHMRWGAMRSSLAMGSSPTSAKHAVTTTDASTTNT